jgi:hypothetical protein
MSEQNPHPHADPAATSPDPARAWSAPELRRWVAPAARDLPPLTHLTLVSGITGDPIDGDGTGFPPFPPFP